jgi:chaperonin GroES
LQFKAVKPVGDRVLVKVAKQESKTAGGLLLPSASQTKPTAGAVVSAGDVQHVKVGPLPCGAAPQPGPAAR